MGLLDSAENHLVSSDDPDTLADDLRIRLLNAQFDLRTADFPVLLLLTGDDRPGMEYVLGEIGSWLDARYLKLESFAPATEEERERPRFWRYWRALPEAGQIGVMVGGWAGGTCTGRMTGDVSRRNFLRAIEQDNAFESSQSTEGALVLKFWFHLDKKAHRKRLRAAKKSPRKLWYVDERDEHIYENYDKVVETGEEYREKTNTIDAPWHVIDGADQALASLQFARITLEAIEARLTENGQRTPSSREATHRNVEGNTSTATTSAITSASPDVLAAVDLSASLEKSDYDEALTTASSRLKGLADDATEARVTAVLVFEGWDAAGKGGVIRRLTRPLDIRNTRVVPIAAPSADELAHHYLRRFWRHLPRAGSTLIFDRSWYGRVLVERVEGLASPDEWGRAYQEIREFEVQLVEHGYVLLKFWLHLDPAEQLRRFQAREQTPYKKYKITEEDYRNRDRWDEYVTAVNDMVHYTDSQEAPWHLISSQDKRWARVRVIEAICDALQQRLKK
ncbi:MAG: polyphosphate:AMP phosphotransferase [Pseudomonadota bacterium]